MKYHGKDLILSIDDGLGFARVEAQRSTSVTLTQETADTSSKDLGWRQSLQAAGVTASQITASGIATDGGIYQLLFAKKMARQHVLARIVGGIIDYTAYYQITSLAASGTHNGAETFDLTLDISAEYGGGDVPIGCLGATNQAAFSPITSGGRYKFFVNDVEMSGSFIAEIIPSLEAVGYSIALIDDVLTLTYIGAGYSRLAGLTVDATNVEIDPSNTNPTAYADSPNFGACLLGG